MNNKVIFGLIKEVKTDLFEYYEPFEYEIPKGSCGCFGNCPSLTHPTEILVFKITPEHETDTLSNWILDAYDYSKRYTGLVDFVHHGVDAGKDPTRLAGISYHADNNTHIEKLLMSTSMFHAREGNAPDVILLPSSLYKQTKDTFLSYTGETVRVIEDPSLPDNKFYTLTLSSWKKLVFYNGKEVLVCNSPGRNSVTLLKDVK